MNGIQEDHIDFLTDEGQNFDIYARKDDDNNTDHHPNIFYETF